MKRFIYSICVIALFSISCYAQQEEVKGDSTGQVIDTVIPAPSLKGNMLYTPDFQPIAVYLPPSYNNSNKKYPVVYYLPGFGDNIIYYTVYGAFGFRVNQSLDELINSGKINEMIFVMTNPVNIFAGHFYVNSPVSGNWEDFIVKDLVQFVDANYRTIKDKESRGISGHSMGGFGALNLAMLHPDVFSMAYALSPGLFAEGGIDKHKPLTGKVIVKEFLNKQEELSSMNEKEALIELMAYMYQRLVVQMDYETAFCYAYGTAFSPDPEGNPPYIKYMHKKDGDDFKVIEENKKNYENGFGNLIEKVKIYENNLKSLKSITIDVGTNDEYVWISEGCQYFSKLLNQRNIEHSLYQHDGGHSNFLNSRP